MTEAYACVSIKPEYLSGRLLTEISGDTGINTG
ncbi:MAG: hypothetical protein AMDU4_FER2C00005G0008 [Ferroplasma sp. Type II]|nr:MAG: hypothetical protein AMDU4_FER2C00005G0008 [Ferroplasma sp. Type II]